MTRGGKYGAVHTNAPEAKKLGRPRGAKDKQPRKRRKILQAHEDEQFGKRRRQEEEESDEDLSSMESEGEQEQEQEQDEDGSPSVNGKEQPEIVWPAHVMFVAQSQCGKTNAIKNVIKKKDFDNVFLVTATKGAHELDHLVNDKELCILHGMNSQTIEDMCDYHERVKQEFGRYPRTLVAFDDFVGIDFNYKTNPMLNLLASSGRNMGFCVLFSCQTFEQIPTMLRRNAHYLFLGKNSDGVIKQMTDELATASMGGAKGMRDKLRKLELRTGEFPFLYVDKRKRKHFEWTAPKLLVADNKHK